MIAAKQTEFRSSSFVFLIRGSVQQVTGEAAAVNNRHRLWVDGVEILPVTGFGLRPVYGSGFDWGKTAGNGIYITSLSICMALFKEERLAENLFVCFKEEFAVYFPSGNFELEIDMTEFLGRHKNRLKKGWYSRFCFSSFINSREILLYKDPVSGLITANLVENYALHNSSVPDIRIRRLNERKQRLVFKLFARENYRITGDNFPDVMQKVEMVMSVFYWKSMQRIIKKQLTDKL